MNEKLQTFELKVDSCKGLIRHAHVDGGGRVLDYDNARILLSVKVEDPPAELIALLDKLFDNGSGAESPEVEKVLRFIAKLQLAKALADALI